MAFNLPDLGFAYNALEPYIDATTMEVHHTRHHAAYLNKFNAAIEKTGIENKTPASIFSEISRYNSDIRNNGGGFYNHALFWQILSPHSYDIIDSNFINSISKYFGTLEQLKEAFSKAAASQFGSGWAWLIKKSNGDLAVTSTPNQDNPLMDINPVKGKPLLCLDVWEHAYYLNYLNRRNDYIDAFWNIVNWDKVVELYNE